MLLDAIFVLAAALFPFVFPYMVLHEMFASAHARAWARVSLALLVVAVVGLIARRRGLHGGGVLKRPSSASI